MAIFLVYRRNNTKTSGSYLGLLDPIQDKNYDSSSKDIEHVLRHGTNAYKNGIIKTLQEKQICNKGLLIKHELLNEEAEPYDDLFEHDGSSETKNGFIQKQ